MMRAWMAAVMVAAAGIMTAAGCNTSVEVSSSCPPAKPGKDAACSATNESCEYQDGPCAMTFTCDAQEHTWQVESSVCQPSAVDCWSASDGDICALPGESCGEDNGCGGFFNECGEDHHWHASYADGGECCWGWENECSAVAPAEGDPCDPCSDSTCTYGDVCGTTTASCGPDGAWHLAFENDCPPSDGCAAFGSQADCVTHPACRWLVPGCGEPPLPEAGCFAKVDCSVAGCAPDQTCEEVVFDPCYDSNCDACGASTFVCL